MVKNLCLLYTLKCNYKCAHCITRSNNRYRSKIGISSSKKIIRAFKKTGLKAVTLAGGEPFLFFEDMVKLVDFCRKNNLFVNIVTNAFWAEDINKTERILKKLNPKGKVNLYVSFDEFHYAQTKFEKYCRTYQIRYSKGIYLILY